jgi:hypothetical protein
MGQLRAQRRSSIRPTRSAAPKSTGVNAEAACAQPCSRQSWRMSTLTRYYGPQAPGVAARLLHHSRYGSQAGKLLRLAQKLRLVQHHGFSEAIRGQQGAIMRSRMRVALLIVGVSVLLTAPARADQIALTSGLIDLTVFSGGAFGSVQLAGDRGFTFVGNMNGGFRAPVGDPLPPGTPLALIGGASGLDLGGNATLDGVSYTAVGSLAAPSSAAMQLTTTAVTLPAVLGPPTMISTPFILDFFFSFVEDPDDGLKFQSLFGSGTATIFLAEDIGFGVPSWRVTGVRAELSSDPAAPVPEPASLTLLGLGFVGLGARRWRQRKV